MKRPSRCVAKLLPIVLTVCLGLAACSEDRVPAQDQAVEPAIVSTITVETRSIALIDELPARVSAFRIAEIRPQVSGMIDKRLFDEGSDVAAGQPLFQISPETFQADVDSARASLQKAEAVLHRARGKLKRSSALLEGRSVSRQSHDDAVADEAAAAADVAQARATLNRREIELSFATIKAPIAGRIGSAKQNEGALAKADDASPLATIQQIDKVYVDVRRPLGVIDAGSRGTLRSASDLPIEILSATGKPYPVKGNALFSDISVDPATGNVTVRVLVDNPGQILLPGMFVRARLPRGTLEAIAVPQQAVVRGESGEPQVVIIDKDGGPRRRTVTLGEAVAGQYVVASGLQSGETIIVEGQDRVQENRPIRIVAYVSRNTLRDGI